MPVLPDDKSTVCNPHARDPPSCRLQPAAGAIDRPARAPTPCGRARTACQIYAARRAHGPAARRKLADPKGEGTVRAVASGAKTPSTFGLVGFSSRCDPRSGFALGGSSIEYVRTRGRRERPAGAWCLVCSGRRWRLLNRGAHVVRRWGPCVPNRTCHGPLNLSLIVSSMFLLMSTYCTTKDAIYLAVSG
jgi:hypothetical protein